MFKYLAHASEIHTDTKDNMVHLLEVWYTSIPIYLISTALIFTIIFYASKKSVNTAFIVTSFWFLATGVMLYDTSPVISTIGIVLGLLTSAIFSFGGLNKK